MARRTKEWWARLTADERSRLYWLERGDKSYGGSWNLPDGMSECGFCSQPSYGGLCRYCLDELIAIRDKAEAR